MGLAETAELLTVLKLRNELGPGLAGAEGELQGFNDKAATTATHVNAAGAAMHGASKHAITLGGALGHAKTKLGELVSGPLGMIGLGVGLAGVGKFIDDSLKTAEDLALTTQKVARATGMAVTPASLWVAVLGKYGIEGDSAVKVFGMMEKNVGALTATTKKATAFQKEYGFSLIDSNGHVKDANTLILQQADYFNNKAIPAQIKDAELAKLFGRSWQSLIPVLALGSHGIQEAAKAADELGLKLDKTNIGALTKFRTAQLGLGEAMKALSLQVGVTLMPLLTDAAKGITGFLEHGGINQIKGFVTGFVGFARTLAGVAGTILSFWNRIPQPFRDMLVGGAIANKALKFTFGFGAGDILKAVTGGGIGSLFSRGGPGNPMHVFVDGGTGGLGGGPGGGKGGLSALGVVGAGLGGLAIADLYKSQVIDPALSQQNATITASVAALINNPRTTRTQLQSAIAAAQSGAGQIRGQAFGLGGTLWGGQADQLDKDVVAMQRALMRLPVATAAENKKHALTKDMVKAAVHDGNRDVAARTDVRQMQFAVTLAERQTGQNIASVFRSVGQFLAGTDRSGFAGVVSAVQSVTGAIAGLPAYFGTAAAAGRGTGPGGRVSRPVGPAGAPVGIENNRHIYVQSSVTPRSNDYANHIQNRYGPTASRAGAA